MEILLTLYRMFQVYRYRLDGITGLIETKVLIKGPKEIQPLEQHMT